MKITDILLAFIAMLIYIVFLLITIVLLIMKAILQGITLIFTQFYESIIWLFTDDSKQYKFKKYIIRKLLNIISKIWTWLATKERELYV